MADDEIIQCADHLTRRLIEGGMPPERAEEVAAIDLPDAEDLPEAADPAEQSEPVVALAAPALDREEHAERSASPV